jgi:hypothetical protein
MFWWLDKQQREIRGTTHYTVAELPEVTIGRIVGVARPLDDKTVIAPLSGRACLAYFARVSDKTFGHSSSQQADLELAAESGGTPFLLEDETGTAIIDPDGARCVLAIDDKLGTTGDADERRRAFLMRYAANDLARDWIRWYEGIVSAGERIAVVGYGTRSEGRLRMSSSPHLPLVICDHVATTKVRS